MKNKIKSSPLKRIFRFFKSLFSKKRNELEWEDSEIQEKYFNRFSDKNAVMLCMDFCDDDDIL